MNTHTHDQRSKMKKKTILKNSKKQIKKNPTEELAEALDGWRRARADYDNLKKRTAEERVQLIGMSNKELILDLLPIVDNFDAAFKSLPEGTENNWIVGFEYIKKQLDTLLETYGVTSVKALGELFNPEFHESAGERQDASVENDTVVEEQRKGYQLHGIVIRPARVIVAKNTK